MSSGASVGSLSGPWPAGGALGAECDDEDDEDEDDDEVEGDEVDKCLEPAVGLGRSCVKCPSEALPGGGDGALASFVGLLLAHLMETGIGTPVRWSLVTLCSVGGEQDR